MSPASNPFANNDVEYHYVLCMCETRQRKYLTMGQQLEEQVLTYPEFKEQIQPDGFFGTMATGNVFCFLDWT